MTPPSPSARPWRAELRARSTPKRPICTSAGPTRLADDTPEEASSKLAARTDAIAQAVTREQRDLAGLDDRLGTLGERQAATAVAADRLTAEAGALEEATSTLEDDVVARRSDLDAATRLVDATQGAADEAEQARHRSAARAEALERALHDLQGAGGRELLRDVDGVVGSLVDLVEIDEGWEAAFEAAVGAGVATVVVDGRASAHEALATLRAQGVTGAVLAPRTSGLPPSTFPAHAESVRSHVRARHGESVADSVLDALVGTRRPGRRLGSGHRSFARARADLVVVTVDGDRFAVHRMAGSLIDQRGHRRRARRSPTSSRRGRRVGRRHPHPARRRPERPWPPPARPWWAPNGPSTGTRCRAPPPSPSCAAPKRSTSGSRPRSTRSASPASMPSSASPPPKPSATA